MSKAFVAGLVAGVTLLIVVGVGASCHRHQTADEEAFQKELPDATPVRLGVLTKKQRYRSKLCRHYQVAWTISDMVAKQSKGKVVGTTVLPGHGALLKPETPENFFRNIAHSSDAIIRGRVLKKAPQITDDGDFLFTDYDIAVSEIMKNNPIAPLNINASVSVTWPGGKVLLQGVIVKAFDANLGLPAINNRDLVLFLRFIPETGAYQPTDWRGGFELEGSSIRPLSDAHFPPGVLGTTDSFLETLSTLSR
jgi:hypothetical protein